MKMTDEQLLSILQKREDDAASYVYGELAGEREAAINEYYRQPYGNEEEGWSDIVTSDVQDTVEWVLPGLLKIFTSTDKAVSFDPQTEADVEATEQATDSCNYVFYKQNNGFLVLYTAIKDALTVKNCAVHWRKETKEVVSNKPFDGATGEMLTYLVEQGAEIESAAVTQGMDELGNPVELYSGMLKAMEKKQTIKVEAFPPENLLVSKDWNSPLLADCPYVCRMMQVSASDLKEMGYDVEPSDLTASDGVDTLDRNKDADVFAPTQDDDESQNIGFLRVEYVLVDSDGDGISERREILRLKNKILSNEVCANVPIATASPILNPHRWDGMSLAEAVSDLQKLHTELLRQTLNSAYLANNPRTKVLTDSNWTPYANIDDLLDSRPGGIIRERQGGAVNEYVTPFVGGHTLGLMEYVATLRENRTGVTRYNQGIDANSLNKTASGINAIMTASQQRMELVARIFAEVLLKPIFQGILKLLTEGGIEQLSFRLRDKFVQYDPNTWRDWYDMTINVGLGTGNTEAQIQRLQIILMAQKEALQIGIASKKNIYNALAKITEAAGFKNISDFWTDPEEQSIDPSALMQKVQQMQEFIRQHQEEYQKALHENATLKLRLENKAGELNLKEKELGLKSNDEKIKADTDIVVSRIEAQSAERIAAMESDVQNMATQLQGLQTIFQAAMQAREPVQDSVGAPKRKTVVIQAPSGQTYTGVIEEQDEDSQ
jgi:hypothetical protein